MLYKYSAILDIDSDEYNEIKCSLDSICNSTNSSLQEMSIKEQLKYYIEKNIAYNIKDRDRMFELIDEL